MHIYANEAVTNSMKISEYMNMINGEWRRKEENDVDAIDRMSNFLP